MKKKKIFILPLLILLSIITAFICLGSIGYILYLGLLSVSVLLPKIFFIISGIITLLGAAALINICLIISPLARFSFGQKYVYQTVNALFPLIMLWGKVLHISRGSIECSFVDLNNKLVSFRHIKVCPKDLLVISPHCLQLASCKYKITYDINNCHQCGGCTIGAMLQMAQELGFNFHVVTGGTLARNLVKKIRPKLILAIACERDLSSGIQEIGRAHV